jgi:hypothetical protein
MIFLSTCLLVYKLAFPIDINLFLINFSCALKITIMIYICIYAKINQLTF